MLRDAMSDSQSSPPKRMGRPPLENPKVKVTMRYDADIVDTFRSTGEGWQTRMNEALRTFLTEHPLNAQ
jgi:uncharacterized protein (DUF4415 family)